jgi:uncharacterized protein
MARRIPRHQCGPQLARKEGRLLLIYCAHLSPLRIIQYRQADRPRNMVIGKLGGCTDINDVIKAKRLQVKQRGKRYRHSRVLTGQRALGQQRPLWHPPAMKALILTLLIAPAPALADAALIAAARGQVGVTVIYDPAYVSLDFPGGDIAPERGVCTDVVIRALREGWGIDLQLALNRDMKADFAAYPANWGLTTTDRNIDHRRVPNLQVFLDRMGAGLPVTSDAAAFQPGDVVTWMLPGNLPHIGIMSDEMGESGAPMVLHNIGQGAREEDRLFDFPITGHYRITPEARARMEVLGR